MAAASPGVLWANFHGSFVILPAFAALAVANDRLVHRRILTVRRQLGPLAGTFLLPLVNPQGLGAYTYPFRLAAHESFVAQMTEWRSPDFHDPLYLALGLLALGALVLPRFTGRRPSVLRLVLLLGLVIAFLLSRRNGAFLALYLPLYLAHCGLAWPLGGFHDRPALNAVLTLAALGAVLVLLPSNRLAASMPAGACPAGALGFIAKHGIARQTIDADSFYGDCEILRGLPDFIDGRVDLFVLHGSVYREDTALVSLSAAPSDVAPRYGARYIWVPRPFGQARYLAADPHWGAVCVPGPGELGVSGAAGLGIVKHQSDFR